MSEVMAALAERRLINCSNIFEKKNMHIYIYIPLSSRITVARKSADRKIPLKNESLK
jgi:hypothetical protein